MKNLLLSAALFALATPVFVSAQSAGFATTAGVTNTPIQNFVVNVVTFVNGILLPAVLAIAFLVFVWGIFIYFIAGGADEEKRSQGKNLMIYATLGFVFIVIFWGLVNFVANSLGLGDGRLQIINLPGITPDTVGGAGGTTAPGAGN